MVNDPFQFDVIIGTRPDPTPTPLVAVDRTPAVRPDIAPLGVPVSVTPAPVDVPVPVDVPPAPATVVDVVPAAPILDTPTPPGTVPAVPVTPATSDGVTNGQAPA